jgi:hypothetical protein
MTESLTTPLEPTAPLQEYEQVHNLAPQEAAELGHIAIENLVQPKNLEALRFGVRGDDEAVQEVGTEADQQRLTDILTDPGSHTREELLEATFVNYSGDVYGDKQWVKKQGAWGDSPEVVTAYGQLMEAHSEWAQLSLDPGFMTHLPTFMDMLDKGEITAPDYEGARQQLKDKLGDKTVWRGTMLTDEELAKVQAEGLGSPLSRVVQGSEQPKEQFEASALSAWPSYTIEKHFHGEHRATPLLSVSEYPEVAISVGRHFGDKSQDKKFYLFKLSVPAIDLVSYTDHAFKAPSMIKQMQDRNPDFAIKVGVNGEQASHKWDESVESFVPWKIDAAEILEVSQPDITESSWNGRVTGKLAA